MTLCTCGHTEQEHHTGLNPIAGKTCSQCLCVEFQKSPYPCDQIDWSDYAPDEILNDDPDCPLCGKPLKGEIGTHKTCSDYEAFMADRNKPATDNE